LSYEKNKKDAKLLLMRENPTLGNMTALQIAKIADDMEFMSHACVQESLNKIWYHKIAPETGLFWVRRRSRD
jgi:hypothetical protein